MTVTWKAAIGPGRPIRRPTSIYLCPLTTFTGGFEGKLHANNSMCRYVCERDNKEELHKPQGSRWKVRTTTASDDDVGVQCNGTSPELES